MYDFAAILTAVDAFVTAALALIDPSTLIGGAIAVLIGAGILFTMLRWLIGIAVRRR